MYKWVGTDIENEGKREGGGERKDEIQCTYTHTRTHAHKYKYNFLQKYMYAI